MASRGMINAGISSRINHKIGTIFKHITILYHSAVNSFLSEAHNYYLWNIACFALGIIFYFAQSTEFNLYFLSLVIGALLGCVLIIKNSLIRFLILPLFFFLFGLNVAAWRTHMIPSHGLISAVPSAKIYGFVEALYPAEGNHAKLLVKIKRVYPEVPRINKLQVTTRNLNPDVKVGDLISFYASISPISKQQFPYGYNFARHAYFNRISGSAYSLSNMWIVKPFKLANIMQQLERLRMKIFYTLENALGKVNGGIAAALMIGEQKSISTDVMNDMRISGLSHILSVSGLHLSLVTIICMFAIRYLLSHSLYLAQQYNIKKVAAFISIVISLGYLCISGMQVAAIRAFIMSAAVMLSILLDKQDNAKSSVFIAAFLILLFSPESILHPSFQMSFSAVIALVASYEFYMQRFTLEKKKDSTLLSKLKFYFLGTLFSSFVAGTATSIFVIYHFHTYSNYSVLANLLVAPVVSMLIMPSIILTFFLFPLGLQHISLYILNIGISTMLKVAKYISSLPASSIILPPFSYNLLFIFSGGLLWFCIWDKKWKLLGFLPIGASFIMLLFTSFPEIILDARYGAVIARSDTDELIRVGGPSHVSKLHRAQWITLLGGGKDILFCPLESPHYFLNKPNYTAAITFRNANGGHTKEVASVTIYNRDGKQVTINKADLDTCGTLFMYADRDGEIKYTKCYINSNHPW